MENNPFNQNPLTRNRSFPTVVFASSPDKAKELQVPEAKSSWREMQEYYDNLHVPQQESPTSKLGAFNVKIAKDETRIINVPDSHGICGDVWGRDELAKEQYQEKISKEYAKQSAIENAKLSVELEKDEFRKQLLADVDSGKLFPNTRLEEIDESKKQVSSNQRQTKEN